MKLSLRHLMAGLGTALFLAACGGGGGGDDTPPPPPVNPPTAVISASAQSVPIGTAVTLDGSGSTTPNNGPITYEWTLSDKPEGSAVSLSGTEASASFTPDVEGDYVVQLTVHDGTASGTATQTITATNPNPVAVISPGGEVSILLGNTVTLDGSSSRPPTGGDPSALRYEWTLLEKPEGDTTELTDTGSASVSFLAAKEGIYQVRLVVVYGELKSQAEVTVFVNKSNSAPIAAAKVFVDNVELDSTIAANGSGNIVINGVITRGQTVTLDASASHDPDGDSLSYRWFFGNSTSDRPRGSSAVISNHTSVKASFVPDAVGTYNVDLTVYDQSVATTQRYVIKVDPNGEPNTRPVAAIWEGLPSSYECERGAYCQANAGKSYDLDGDDLTYNWVWWNSETPEIKNEVSTKKSSLVDPAFSGSTAVAGTYVFELTVNDGQEDSDKVTSSIIVKEGANAIPRARITVANERVLVGEVITFSGKDSSDPNDDPLSYKWTLIDRPDGSRAVLQNATSVEASVQTDKPGIYAVQLVVTDPKGFASSVNYIVPISKAFAKAVNNPPVVGSLGFSADGAAAGQARIISDGATTTGVNLTARIFDPDLDAPLYYMWSVASQPEGSAAIPDVSNQVRVLEGGSANVTRYFNPLVAGRYTVNFLVSDGVANPDPESFSFNVVTRTNYPSLLLERTTVYDTSLTPPPEDSIYSQSFFPVKLVGGVYALDGSDGSTAIVPWYRLTAFDQDYTVTVQDNSNGIVPVLVGISDGMIIRKGESVVFKVSYATELSTPYHLNVTVGVRERDGYTISISKKNTD